jgi:polyketide synthase-associated protein
MPPKKSSAKDIAVASNTPEDVGTLVAGSLAAKGVCVLSEAFDPSLVTQALKDAAALDQQGALKRPPELVAQGLLGEQGSARMVEIDCVNPTSSLDGIVALDGAMGDLAVMLEPFLGVYLGFSCQSRTNAVLHETSSAPPGPPGELSEKEASNWLFQFLRGAIMCVVCLGPTAGSLDLTPFEDQIEESETYSIETTPGSVIFLRSDTMFARHTASSGSASLLTSFLVKEKFRDTKRSQHEVVSPPAKKLRDWATARLDQLKNQENEYPPDVPRDWIQAMNHQCFKGQHMSVRGAGVRYATSWEPEDFHSALHSGLDVCTYVPLVRWDHSQNYNPDPNGWQYMQTWTKHVSCCEGAELFDNKQFAITPAESKVMDPQQRIVLECGYESMMRSGMKKGQIMNSLGGMYLGYGSGNSDFGYIQKTNDSSAEGSFGATGGSAAITANRFSFCLGMKGASIAIDAEDASSLVSVYQGCESLMAKGRLVKNTFAVVGGLKINMAAYFWSQRQAMGFMSPTGRVFAFDAGSDGYVLGDTCCNMCLHPLTVMVDGQLVVKEGEYNVGIVAGSSIGSNGANAKMSAPNGPCEQHVMSQAIRSAGLNGYDINACEVYGMGNFLCDAVEVSSTMRIMRQAELSDDPLPLTCLKTNMGNQTWGCGAAGLLKGLLSANRGCMIANIHLNQLNPHIDGFGDQPINILTENVEFTMQSSYYSSFARGLGGTNAFAVGWGRLGEAYTPPPAAKAPERLVFWPGGGGSLDNAAKPKKGYHISGTFTGWEAEPMEIESPGVYAFTMTLSENRWEQFQVWQDGDAKKALYPSEHKAGKMSPVQGPDVNARGNAWHIDGRSAWTLREAGAPAALTSGGEEVAGETEDWVEVGGLDRGLIGAQYRIRLHVAGKYRMIDWERLSGRTEDADTTTALTNAQALPASTYYVSADWNGFGIEAMTEVPQEDPTTGLFTLDVQLIRAGGEFQIMRNRDWGQVMYPSTELSGCGEPTDVNGPDDESGGMTWYLGGNAGDCFKIEFSRSRTTCLDVKSLSWKFTENKALTEDQKEVAARPRYAVFGSWDAGTRLRELEWSGSYYRVYIELGVDVKESFQIVQDMDWDKIWYPSKADASASVTHQILGPVPSDGKSRGLNWTIGKEGFETAGEVYEVKVQDEPGGYFRRKVSSVTWQRVPRGFSLAEAEAVGLVLRSKRG